MILDKRTVLEAAKGECEVPLVEQLRSIPKDYRTWRAIQWDEDGRETGHQFIPVGYMMHRAADMIDALAVEQPKQNPAAQVALTGNRNATDLSAPASAGPTPSMAILNTHDTDEARIAALSAALDDAWVGHAATERELAAQHYWKQEFYRVEKMVLAEQDRVEELERQLAAAKEAIEDAPHAEYCGVPSSSGAEVYECRCWKAEALSKLGVDREGKL